GEIVVVHRLDVDPADFDPDLRTYAANFEHYFLPAKARRLGFRAARMLRSGSVNTRSGRLTIRDSRKPPRTAGMGGSTVRPPVRPLPARRSGLCQQIVENEAGLPAFFS